MSTIAVGYCHPGTVRAEFMDSLIRTIGWSANRITRIAVRSGADITRARNAVWTTALAMGPDYLWWLDTDMVFNQDTLDRLINNDRAITSALYFGTHEKGADFPVFSMHREPLHKNVGTQRLPIERGTMSDVRAAGSKPFQVAGVGMGCCLIRGDVLDALGAANEATGALWPYAEMMQRLDGKEFATEDDITFCLRAAAQGYPTWVDPKIKVGHVKDRVIWP